MTTYRDLLVWQRGMELIERIYAFTRTLPPEERFGLCSQLQRAAVSVASNIAEGHSRRSQRAFMNHVSIALGSEAEVETLVETCRRLNFGDPALLVAAELCAIETGKMLYGLYGSREAAAAKRGLLYSFTLVVPGLWYLVTSL